jgi:hypothetical protein
MGLGIALIVLNPSPGKLHIPASRGDRKAATCYARYPQEDQGHSNMMPVHLWQAAGSLLGESPKLLKNRSAACAPTGCGRLAIAASLSAYHPS